jgi:hypothetical protein
VLGLQPRHAAGRLPLPEFILSEAKDLQPNQSHPRPPRRWAVCDIAMLRGASVCGKSLRSACLIRRLIQHGSSGMPLAIKRKQAARRLRSPRSAKHNKCIMFPSRKPSGASILVVAVRPSASPLQKQKQRLKNKSPTAGIAGMIRVSRQM